MNTATLDPLDLIIDDLVRLKPQVAAHAAKAPPDEAILVLLDWDAAFAAHPLPRTILGLADHPGVLVPEARPAYSIARDLLDHNAKERAMLWPEQHIGRVIVANGRGHVVAMRWVLGSDDPPSIVLDATQVPLVVTHHRGLPPERN